jgi:hypothetical protein
MNERDHHKLACENFLARHPEVKAELDALSQREAGILGISLDEFREWKLGERLQEQADLSGVDVGDFIISVAARSESERKAWMLERHKQTAEAMGMDFEEYCELNPHIKKLLN